MDIKFQSDPRQLSIFHLQDFINLDLKSKPMEKDLGMVWNVSKDSFIFKTMLKEFTDTKRVIPGIITKTIDESQMNHRQLKTSHRQLQTSHRRLQTSHRQLQTSHK